MSHYWKHYAECGTVGEDYDDFTEDIDYEDDWDWWREDED